jgi:hypothetical protein
VATRGCDEEFYLTYLAEAMEGASGLQIPICAGNLKAYYTLLQNAEGSQNMFGISKCVYFRNCDA